MSEPIFTSFGIENSSEHSGRPRTLLALIYLFIHFCDPRVSTRGIASITNKSKLAMPHVETQGSENEEESKQRCATYELIVWIISTFHPPLPSHRSRCVLAIPLTRVDLNIMRP